MVARSFVYVTGIGHSRQLWGCGSALDHAEKKPDSRRLLFLVLCWATVGSLSVVLLVFIAAAAPDHISHILDCMDGKWHVYAGCPHEASYYDRLTESGAGLVVSAVDTPLNARPRALYLLFLAMIASSYGCADMQIRGTIELETACDSDYPMEQ